MKILRRLGKSGLLLLIIVVVGWLCHRFAVASFLFFGMIAAVALWEEWKPAKPHHELHN